jgi:SAM-dependent methyltransferase
MDVTQRLYPETAAGGFCRVDHRMQYLVRVHGVLEPGMTLLDLGAGHGKWRYDGAPLRAWLGDFRNRGARVIAADIDPVVLENPMADERIVIEPGKPMPVADGSVDVVSAFSTFEHVEEPEGLARELDRILRPGGWICGWTPNRWGYVAVGARLTPRALHDRVLRLVEPLREPEDTFPTFYRMNTREELRRLFPPPRFQHFSYPWNGQPFYHGERMALALFWRALLWAAPTPLSAYWHVVIRKAAD